MEKETTQTDLELAKYDTIDKIVKQLELCKYSCPNGNTLETNVAFLALKKMVGPMPVEDAAQQKIPFDNV